MQTADGVANGPNRDGERASVNDAIFVEDIPLCFRVARQQ